ncbi:MAG: hypothetical protein HZB54_04200 [Deltaproteobacteria bacterium]|nr:hypothetical protein [Deltaproteobacteria bacterium]
MDPINVNEKKQFFKDGFRPQILHISPKLKIPLICMEQGQMIPPHPSGAGVFYVLEGSAIFTVAGEKKDPCRMMIENNNQAPIIK